MHTEFHPKANFVTHSGAYPEPCMFKRLDMVSKSLTWVQWLYHTLTSAYSLKSLSPLFLDTQLDTFQFALKFSVALWLYSDQECEGKTYNFSHTLLHTFIPSVRWIINAESNHGSHTLIVGKLLSAWIPKGLCVADLPPTSVDQEQPFTWDCDMNN